MYLKRAICWACVFSVGLWSPIISICNMLTYQCDIFLKLMPPFFSFPPPCKVNFPSMGLGEKICLWRLYWGERSGIDNSFITCAWQQINQHISWMFHNKHNHINNIWFNLFANKRVYLVAKYCFDTHIQMYPLPFTYRLHHIANMLDNKIKKVAL